MIRKVYFLFRTSRPLIDEVKVIKIANIFKISIDGAFELSQNTLLYCGLKFGPQSFSDFILMLVKKEDIVRT